MAVRAREKHRQAGENRVEVLARQRKPGGVDLYHLEPQVPVAATGFEARGDLCLEFLWSNHSIAKIALLQVLCAFGRMSVRVDDARQHDLAVEIDRVGSRSSMCTDRLIRADRDDGITAHRQSLRNAALRIFG